MTRILRVVVLLCGGAALAGDFQHHRVENVHDIFLRDGKGGVIARISITAGVALTESWAHLKDEQGVAAEPAGPGNRRLVATRTGFAVSSYGKTSEAKPPKSVQLVVDELKANGGLLKEPANKDSKSVIAFEDPGFEAALRERLKSTKATITFRSGEH